MIIYPPLPRFESSLLAVASGLNGETTCSCFPQLVLLSFYFPAPYLKEVASYRDYGSVSSSSEQIAICEIPTKYIPQSPLLNQRILKCCVDSKDRCLFFEFSLSIDWVLLASSIPADASRVPNPPPRARFGGDALELVASSLPGLLRIFWARIKSDVYLPYH